MSHPFITKVDSIPIYSPLLDNRFDPN
jgi:hypothetical protein